MRIEPLAHHYDQKVLHYKALLIPTLGSMRYLLHKVVSVLSMLAKTQLPFRILFSYLAQRKSSGQRLLKTHKVPVWCQYLGMKRSTLRDLQGRFSNWLVLALNGGIQAWAIAITVDWKTYFPRILSPDFAII
jgi:hypothetical protein